MKNNLMFKTIVAFVAIFSLIACDNEPLEGEFADGPIPVTEADFQVDIDGVTFVADQATAQTVMGNTVIIGATSTGEAVSLNFAGSGTGTFSLITGGSAGSASYLMAGDANPYTTLIDGMIGEITITAYDLENNLISGTFSFTASRYVDPQDETQGVETKEFTTGIFSNVPLESDVTPNPGPQGIFQVELDGNLLVGESISASFNADGLLISATNGVQEISFQIFDPTMGSFDLQDEEQAIVLYDPDNTNDTDFLFHSTGGTINITALDETAGTVSGNFDGILTELFDAAPDIQMTNGIFENITFSTNAPTDSATALIDGVAFDATIFPIVFVGGTIQATFSNDLNESITLIFPSGVSGGTYQITAPPAGYSGKYTVDTGTGEQVYNSIAGMGEIVITSIANNILVGSFHFDAEDGAGNTVSITEGEFTIDIN